MEKQIFRGPGMWGGLNTRDARGKIDLSESPDALNVEWQRYGSVTRRRGFKLWIPKTYPNQCYGLGRFIKSDGSKYALFETGGVMRAWKGTPPSEEFSAKTGLTAGLDRQFAQMNDWIYWTAWDGLPPTSQASAATSICRWNGSQASKLGIGMINGDLLTLTASATGGSMVFSASGNQYAYGIARYYKGVGEGTYFLYGTATLTNQAYEILGPGASVAGSVPILGLDDPAVNDGCDEIRIYRSLQYANGGSQDGPFYYLGKTTAADSWAFTDTAADAALTILAPERPIVLQEFMIKCKYLCHHNGRMFYANTYWVDEYFDEDLTVLSTKRSPSRLYWSDLYGADRIMGFVEVNPEDGQQITGIASFYDQLVIFKSGSIYVLTGTSPENFTLRLVTSGVGCVAASSVAPLENHLVFLGQSAVYAYDGSSVARISEAIRPNLEALTGARQAKAAAAVHRGRYFLSVVR